MILKINEKIANDKSLNFSKIKRIVEFYSRIFFLSMFNYKIRNFFIYKLKFVDSMIIFLKKSNLNLPIEKLLWIRIIIKLFIIKIISVFSLHNIKESDLEFIKTDNEKYSEIERKKNLEKATKLTIKIAFNFLIYAIINSIINPHLILVESIDNKQINDKISFYLWIITYLFFEIIIMIKKYEEKNYKDYKVILKSSFISLIIKIFLTRKLINKKINLIFLLVENILNLLLDLPKT